MNTSQMPRTADRATTLSRWIDDQPENLGNDWLRTLDERKREEAEFHDSDRADHQDEDQASTSNRRFYDAATPVRRYVDDWIASRAPGAVFLDYACGNGAMTVRASRAGASLAVGIDISEVSVSNARENAASAGVSTHTRFLQRDCEQTGFPDGSFDAILCSGMLHHLDLSRAYPELLRILAPGGRILCVEALSYNPAIRLYRNLTPGLRTKWEKEHILGMKEVRLAAKSFEVDNLKFFLLSAPLATLLPKGVLRNVGLTLGHAVDKLLTRVPLLSLWSWQFSFELVRPAEAKARYKAPRVKKIR